MNPITYMKNRFIIIDGNAILHRAWHAMPPLTTKDGTVISAAYGFTSMLLKVLKDLKPTHIAVTFDLSGGTFRHEAFEEYKAHRVTQPQELYDQIPLVKDILEGFDIPVYEAEGYEADDVIGTLSKKAPKDTEVIIVTGDLDTLQLVDKRTRVYTSRKGLSDIVIYDEAAVKERYGLTPDQLIDYKAMRGDSSDNLPGLKGIGEKGATSLLAEHGSIEKIYKALKKDPEAFKPRVRKALEEGEEEVPLSKELVTIVRNLDVGFSFKDVKLVEPDMEALRETFQELEFKNLFSRVEKQFGKQEQKKKTLKTVPKEKKKTVQKKERTVSLKEKLGTPKAVSYRISYASAERIEPKCLSIALYDGKEAYVTSCTDGVFPEEVVDILKDKNVLKIGHDMKRDLLALASHGMTMEGPQKDVIIMSYLLNPGSRAHDMESLIFEETGRKQEKQDTLFPEENAKALAEEAEIIWDVADRLEAQMKDEKLTKVFSDIDMPLVPVLAGMERHGIRLDTDFLKKMSVTMKKKIDSVTKKIYKTAGEEFNINSPAQLQAILFEKLLLPTQGIKKTSTGQISTAASELEKLRNEHPIIKDIFVHREYSKLLSTYVKALPELVHPSTGRLHTDLNQTITATGRLSSSNPNLQNIPVRTELGREVRKAFIADPGYVLLAADYSQIELRIAASIADDKKMIQVFKKGEDFHRSTAAEIWEVEPEEVTFEQRRAAKAINFGILYGMGSTALAASTGIKRSEAKEFIAKYLRVFRGLHNYMEDAKKLVKRRGWVETMFGRRRYLPEIHSGVPFLRAEAERMAINMPVQGTQADLIKLAMIELHERIGKEYGFEPNAKVKMLLQVHDELIFEVKKPLAVEASKWISKIMAGAVKLKVPVDVNVKIGQSWGELE